MHVKEAGKGGQQVQNKKNGQNIKKLHKLNVLAPIRQQMLY